MASDYKKIAEDHEKRYGWDVKHLRIYKRLYSDKTHFVYELIQNADDSKSQHLELQLNSNALLVWNDGRQFNEKDVRSICSLGSSDKDLTNIGTFGIGFKAVYNYTDFPEIYSDDERFCIRDFIKPEGIDEMTTEIAELVNEGKTVFRLPFKDSLHQDDIDHLKNRLCNLSKERALLFLRDLKRVAWKDECNSQTGYYACHRDPYDKIQNVPENESVELVELIGALNGNNQPSETFLVFCKEVHPPEDVIDKLLEQAEDEEEQQRIQQSAEELQPIEVAFKLQDDRITAMDDNCVLFAYLPTQKETHLKFLIQARYQTTPARDNIPKPSENPWNRWLVQETAKFLPEILEQLKASDLLEPAFFNVLPLKRDVENEFKPTAEALQKAMQERAFVPTQNGGYAKAENVFYPHRESLRELVESSWLYPNSSWLHPEIRDTEEFRRCFKVMHEAGVKEIGISQVLGWLEKQGNNWFESRCEEWLRSLYVYLNSQKSELGRIKRLPLVRLENGRHVSTNYDESVFFPPDTYEGREELKPFLRDLPILQSALLDGEEGNDIKAFLDKLGVRVLNPQEMISKWIMPKYRWSDRPSKEQNHLHVRYIFKVWDKLLGDEHRQLKEELSKVPILLAYNSGQPETYDFVKPCDAHLPKAYTGDTDLEAYFSVCNGDIWFVDDAYLEDESDVKAWFQFLKAIGSMDTPCIIEKTIPAKSERDQEFDKELDKRNIKSKRSTWWSQTNIEDFYLQGLSEILAEISEHKRIDLSQVCWCLLVKVLPSEQKARDAFFQGTYHRFYYSNRSDPFDATFYRQLKETAWLPDEQGNLHIPSECFAPTSENRRVLGDSVVYLHPDFDVSQVNETAQWLVEKLGIHLNANTDSVINYLQTLSGTETSVEKVEPLYRFLARQDARRSEEFKQKPLIFTSNSEPRWWRSDEVFWEDESPVFGNRRGYLKENYADYEGTLKPFFRTLDVSERAAPSDYVQVIQEVTSVERSENAEVRDRVETLYRYIMPHLKEGDNSLENEGGQKEWDRIREGRCWLGKKGDEWGFFFWHELVWKDDDYRYRLFKDKVRFWAFDNDLVELAKNLGVKGCYEISDVEFNYYNEQGENQIWSEKVRNLHPYIHDFLHSPNLCKGREVKKSAEILDQISVCQAEKLKVEYKLNRFPVPDPNPRQSFLDERNQTLWLGLEEDEKAYPDLIGDALQDYFRIDQLREFVKDLLPSTNLSETALLNWKRRGFQPDLCLVPPESDSKEDDKNTSESVDEKLPNETSSEDDSGTNDSEIETPKVHEDSETGNGDDDSGTNDSKTPTYRPRPSRGGTRPRGGNGSSTPSRSGGTGYSGSGGGGGEGEEHRTLKEHLAANPSLFGEGLELVGTEYRFRSGDEADILFGDSSGNPVTVEVKPPILSGSDQEVWQAVKYKHLAAVKYGLPCEQVRSILAAPEIPDDVKEECERRGIEPFEVTQR